MRRRAYWQGWGLPWYLALASALAPIAARAQAITGTAAGNGTEAVGVAAAAAAANAKRAPTSAPPEGKEPLGPGEHRFDYGAPFGTVTLYVPAGKPTSVVIFVSGDGGWHLGVISMARHLSSWGAAVAGIDVRRYLVAVAAARGSLCHSMAVDFEALAHRVERELGMSDYLQPLLYGYSSGATLVYATLVQSPPGTFGAAVSLGFCPDLKFGEAPLCAGEGAQLRYHANDKGAWVFDPAPKLSEPWVAFQGDIDEVCSAETVAAFAGEVGESELVRLPHVGHGFGVEKNWLAQFQRVFERLAGATRHAAAGVAPQAPEVADLPLIEQPATGNPSAPLALLLTGDGGWAGLDRGIAQALNVRGVPLVALSSLRYFWHARTPAQTAADVARVIRHYLAAWDRERVMLIGYSFGADVLPFIVERLPPDLRARILSVNLLGLSDEASFVIHVSGWLSAGQAGLPVKPELDKMAGINALCLYGAGERDDPCARDAGATVTAERVGTGHHFGGDYGALARAMLEQVGLESGARAAPR